MTSLPFPRNCRIGVDLVFDEPQRELIQEIKIVQGLRQVLNKTMEMSTEQVRLLRRTSFSLNKVLENKDASLEVDAYAQRLNVHRSEVKRQARLLLEDDNDDE